MSAVLALKSARAVGIRVRIDGDHLELEAPAQPPQAVLEVLSRHKADILRLGPTNDDWSQEDWQGFFDERAGIAEFDGGLPPAETEAGDAFACCVAEWINRNPTPSVPGRCLVCGGGERPSDPLLPFGTDTIGHAWLHRACWPAWYRAREVEAIATLSSMGIRACGMGHGGQQQRRGGPSDA